MHLKYTLHVSEVDLYAGYPEEVHEHQDLDRDQVSILFPSLSEWVVGCWSCSHKAMARVLVLGC